MAIDKSAFNNCAKVSIGNLAFIHESIERKNEVNLKAIRKRLQIFEGLLPVKPKTGE